MLRKTVLGLAMALVAINSPSVCADEYADALRCQVLMEVIAGEEETPETAPARNAADAWSDRARAVMPPDMSTQDLLMGYLGAVNSVNDTEGLADPKNLADAIACAAEVGLELRVE